MINAKAPSEEQSLPPTLAAVLQRDSTPWYKKPHLLKLNYIIFSITLYASANGYDGSMMNGLQALDPWQDFMHHPTGSWLGFINSVGNLGALSIIFLSAWTVQKYGRRVGIYVGNISLVLGTVLQSAAHNPATFILGRAFIGVANQWLTVSAGLWITETAFPAHRGIAAPLYSCGWYPGSLLAAWVTFGTRNYADSWSWRIPSILQIMIPTIALPGLLLAPESPRYLVSVGKIDEARDVLLKYHSGGNSNDEVLSLELDEIIHTLRREKEANQSSGWADLFKPRGNQHRAYITITMGIFGQWCGNGVVSFYLTLVLNSAGITGVTEQTLINGFLQVWNLIWAVGAAFSVDRLGRRMLFLASALIMGVSYVFVTAFSGSFAETGSKNIGIAVVPFLFIFYAGFDLAFTPLFMSYTAEIWPYNLRSRGLSLVYLTGQTATFLNVFANPICSGRHWILSSWKYYIVYVAILIIGFINMYLTYPETKGHTLEGIREIFDGKHAPGTLGDGSVEGDGKKKQATVTVATAEL